MWYVAYLSSYVTHIFWRDTCVMSHIFFDVLHVWYRTNFVMCYTFYVAHLSRCVMSHSLPHLFCCGTCVIPHIFLDASHVWCRTSCLSFPSLHTSTHLSSYVAHLSWCIVLHIFRDILCCTYFVMCYVSDVAHHSFFPTHWRTSVFRCRTSCWRC